MLSVTVFGVTYDVSNAPVFAKYAIQRAISRWGVTDFSTTPDCVQHYINNLATRFHS